MTEAGGEITETRLFVRTTVQLRSVDAQTAVRYKLLSWRRAVPGPHTRVRLLRRARQGSPPPHLRSAINLPGVMQYPDLVGGLYS